MPLWRGQTRSPRARPEILVPGRCSRRPTSHGAMRCISGLGGGSPGVSWRHRRCEAEDAEQGQDGANRHLRHDSLRRSRGQTGRYAPRPQTFDGGENYSIGGKLRRSVGHYPRPRDGRTHDGVRRPMSQPTRAVAASVPRSALREPVRTNSRAASTASSLAVAARDDTRCATTSSRVGFVASGGTRLDKSALRGGGGGGVGDAGAAAAGGGGGAGTGGVTASLDLRRVLTIANIMRAVIAVVPPVTASAIIPS
jgi:hypothetical protein